MHVLILHTAGDPRPYIGRLAAQGFRFSLVKKRPTEQDRECFAQVTDWNYQEDLEATLDLVSRLHARDPFQGVLSYSESGVIIASLVAAHLGLPGNPPTAALRARNKYLMRQALHQAGLPGPPFHLVRTASQVHDLLRRTGTPMVLKPISGSSSYGVIRLQPRDSLAGIAAHLESVRTYIRTYRECNPQYPFEFWLPPAGHGIAEADVHDPEEDFLLEGFLGGQQVSVDGLVCDGQVSCLGVIEIERIKNSAYFLEYEEWMPTRLGADVEAQVEETVVRTVAALGLHRCCFHCELKVAPEGIAVLELAARRGADNIADFLLRIYGVDIYEEAARLALGQTRVYCGLARRGCMKMRYFIPPKAGILAAVRGAEEVGRDPRVSELDLEFSPGERILVPPAGFEFLGYLSVFAPTPHEAESALEELYPKVEFDIQPGP